MSGKNYTFLCGFIIVIISLNCCKKKQENNFYTSSLQKKDSIINWLSNENNSLDSSYSKVLAFKYDQLIQQKNIQQAYHLLIASGYIRYNYMQYDKIYCEKTDDFLNHHLQNFNRINQAELKFIRIMQYATINDYSKCINGLKKIIFIPKTKYQNKFVGNIYYEIAYGYSGMGKLQEALKFYNKALNYYEQSGDFQGIASVESDLSYIYSLLNQYNDAVKKLNNAQKIFKKYNDSLSLFFVLTNKASLYSMSEDKRLLPMIDTVFSYYKSYNSPNPEVKLYSESWQVYKLTSENKLSQAKNIITNLEPLRKEYPENSIYLYALANYINKSGDHIKNPEIFETELEKIEKQKNFPYASLFHHLLKIDAIKKHDYKKALYHEEMDRKNSDSLYNIKTKIALKNLDNKYQLEKKEKIIAKKNILLISAIAVIILLLLSGISFLVYKKLSELKQKRKAELGYSKKLYNNIEEERKRIASELHDGINHELLTLKANLSGDTLEVQKKIDGIINEIRTISRNLHPVMFEKTRLNHSLEQLVDKLNKEDLFIVNIESNYSGFLDITEELHIYRIIQEAISNTIKHAKAHAAKIYLTEDQQQLKIIIKDNGKGFSVNDKINNNNSFGIHTIFKRSKAIGGKTSIKSSDKGTEITIKIQKT